MDWTSTIKASVLSAMTLALHGHYGIWAYSVARMPDAHLYVDVSQLETNAHIYLLLAFISLLCLMLLPLAKRTLGDHTWYEHIAAQYYALSLCYASYTIGTLTLPTGAVFTGAPVVGFILFNRWAVLWALATALVAHITVTYLTVQGYLEYAPIVRGFGGDGAPLSGFWAINMYLFMAPHLLTLLAIAFYVLRRWRRREEEVRLLSVTDALTGLSNRRSIMSHLNREQNRSLQQGPSLSIVLVDLDHFKSINDTWGHQVGDRVLVLAAQALRESVRQNDLVGRWGGEEFLILLPGTDTEGALTQVERVRAHLRKVVVPLEDGAEVRITGSIGVFCNEGRQQLTVEQLLHYADEALYAAKAAGRDCVVVGGSDGPAKDAAGVDLNGWPRPV